MSEQSQISDLSRRGFMKATTASAAVIAAATMGLNGSAFAAGSDKIRVGLIGCGARGTGAVRDSLTINENIEIIAMGDMFSDRLKRSRDKLKDLGDKYAVKDELCFTGFDAYQKVLATDVDLVILTTPPAFRSIHIRAALEAGKHVFAEKPVAVDPTGVRSVIESAEIASKKNLAFVAGTQRRHNNGYRETIKRIHDGAIGEIVAANCYWNQGGGWMAPRKKEWSDVEWQIRNWPYFTWLSGDHIVEQHIHQHDVMNWVMGTTPISAYGMGGRQVRIDPAYGYIYDHFAVEYEYPNGVLISSMCRQIDGTDSRVSEHIVGTKGKSDPSGNISGANPFQFKEPDNAPTDYQNEHADMVASIRAGKPINEGKQVAESTFTAIMGRMSTYSGKLITWEEALNSNLSLVPPNPALNDSLPVPAVAMPGKTA